LIVHEENEEEATICNFEATYLVNLTRSKILLTATDQTNATGREGGRKVTVTIGNGREKEGGEGV
jgi:hypothetical protein